MSAPGRGLFWPQGNNLNNVGNGQSYESSIKCLGLLLSDNQIFKVFPYMSLCKASDPQREAIFDPRAIICTTLDEATY